MLYTAATDENSVSHHFIDGGESRYSMYVARWKRGTHRYCKMYHKANIAENPIYMTCQVSSNV